MRSVLRTAGVAAILAGLAVGAAGRGTVPVPVTYSAVALTAFAALLAGVGTYVGGRAADRERPAPPDTERGTRVPVPGDRLDRSVADATGTREFRRRLFRRVRASLVEERDCSPDDAEKRIERGTWTDDPVAARFVGSETDRVPLATRLRWRVQGRPAAEESARRAVDALAALREGDRDE